MGMRKAPEVSRNSSRGPKANAGGTVLGFRLGLSFAGSSAEGPSDLAFALHKLSGESPLVQSNSSQQTARRLSTDPKRSIMALLTLETFHPFVHRVLFSR